VTSHAELAELSAQLHERYRQPVLVETFLSGREFTVGIVGTGDAARAVGSIEIVLRSNAEPDVYSYTNKEQCESLVEYRHVTHADPLVAEAERIARNAWIALGCRDGGRVDIRCDGWARRCSRSESTGRSASDHPDLPMIDRGRYAVRRTVRAIVDRRRRIPARVRCLARCIFCCCDTVSAPLGQMHGHA
jgi:D-alanine-D-alanine ligase